MKTRESSVDLRFPLNQSDQNENPVSHFSIIFIFLNDHFRLTSPAVGFQAVRAAAVLAAVAPGCTGPAPAQFTCQRSTVGGEENTHTPSNMFISFAGFV